MEKHNLDSHRSEKAVIPEASSLRAWSIVGAGPVGSMQALILAALFPDQPIHVFDRHRTNVRGHGLSINKSTILRIIKELNSIKKQTEALLEATGNQAEAAHYQQVIKNIMALNTYLKKNFTTPMGGSFLRTYQISNMLQVFAKTLSNNNVHFHLDNEITKEHLMQCKGDAELSDSTKPEALLNQSDIIFGADGAHSRLREVVFEEADKDLEKEVLTHVLEIKLDMKKSPKKLDKFKKSVLATLTRGDMYIWKQSRDGTATLRLFIDKKTYEALSRKIAKKTGEKLGRFTNPYRRLTQLPSHLRKPLEKTLSEIVGIENLDPKSIKVTAIPIHVYKAQKFVKQQDNGKIFILTGDAAVGLALERGFNNGLLAATQLGTTLYKQKNGISNKSLMTELRTCEQALKNEADKQIRAIKKKTSFIQGFQKTVGKILSPYIRSNASPRPKPKPTALDLALKELKRSVLTESIDDKNASLIFAVDRLHIALKSKANRLKKHPNSTSEKDLSALIKSTTEYAQNIVNGKDASLARDVMKNTVINSKISSLCQELIKTGSEVQYLSTLESIKPEDLITKTLSGISAYQKQHAKRSSFFPQRRDHTVGHFRSQTYKMQLENEKLSELTKLSLIYAILSSKDGGTFQQHVANSIVETTVKDKPIDISILKNTIQKLIKSKLDENKTREFFGVLDTIAPKINAKKVPEKEIESLDSYEKRSF